MKLSVIIPCWNDAPALAGTLGRLRVLREEIARAEGDNLELIVADSSHPPVSREAALAQGIRVVHCPAPSRGRQLNLGAREATGEALLFQHVDTELTAAHLRSLLAALKADHALAGGAFHRKFDDRHPRLRWLEPVARLWSQIGAGRFYGDQSIFVRRAVFERLGGFADIPLMEDLDFAGRLRRVGRVRLLDPPIATSPRRHLERGPWRVSLENGALILLYRAGVSPHRLHRWYYRYRRRALAEETPTAAGQTPAAESQVANG